MLHRFGENVGTKRSRHRSGYRDFEEHPDMPTIAGSRSFQRSGQIVLFTRCEDGERVFLPGGLVKVDCEEETAFIQQHRIYACNEIGTPSISPGQVPPNYLVCNRQELLMHAVSTVNAWFLADTP